MRAMLEMNFNKHSTLTVGDIITVWHRGKSYDVLVKLIEPEAQVCLLDTDIEVDLEDQEIAPSGEKNNSSDKQQVASSTASSLSSQVLSSPQGRRLSDLPPQGRRLSDTPISASSRTDDNETDYTLPSSTNAKTKSPILLPPEVDGSDPETISFMIKDTRGQILGTRKFLMSHPVKLLFLFIRQQRQLQDPTIGRSLFN